MNIDLTNALRINTHYNFKKYRDGALVQEENTHNIITNALLKETGSFSRYHYAGMYSLVLGSGTAEPKETDSALTSLLWNKYFGASARTVTADDTSITATQTFTIPAEAAYVGTIAECGLTSGNTTGLKTHALIRDVEGNPITIEKSDIDKLIVTVSITFVFTVPEGVYLVPLDKSTMYYGLSNGYCAPWPIVSKTGNAQRALLSQDYQEVLQNGVNAYTYYDYANRLGVDYMEGCNNGALVPDALTNATIPASGQKRFTGRIGAARLGTNKTYAKAIIFLGLFVIPLPNETYFPAYDMTDIPIGVGDGNTTQFINPLNYFKEGTDIVYKNGTQLVRGVDYTIDHRHNNDKMPELFASADAIITGGVRSRTSDPHPPIFRPAAFPQGAPYSSNYSWTHCHRIDSFSTVNPLFFDCKKSVDINYLKIGINHNNYVYTLYYSNDGSEYIEAVSFTKTASVYEATFETISARYWKLTVSPLTGDSSVNSGYTTFNYSHTPESLNTAYSSLNHPELYCSLGYKGDPYITFTEAPAADDVITMDVTLDIPFKNANNVIDYDFTLTLF